LINGRYPGDNLNDAHQEKDSKIMKKKIAVIGMGNICKKAYMPILGVNNDLDLMLYNRSPEPLKEIQAKYRVNYGTNDLVHIPMKPSSDSGKNRPP
jgi:lactate dehydrogenase-like 2-hydroxyacid dehydrogenase